MIVPTSSTEKLSFSTVRIDTVGAQGAKGTGTGFVFDFRLEDDKSVPCIITNRHVLAGATVARFLLHGLGPAGGPAAGVRIPAEVPCTKDWVFGHPDREIDLCAVPIAPLVKKARSMNQEVYYQALDSSHIWTKSRDHELSGVEDILMVGYPNGIWDAHNNMPIMRRGATATHPALDYQGKTQFLIDAACYPGSSGSPVFLFGNGIFVSREGSPTIGTRIALLGIQFAVYQYSATGEIRVIDAPTAQVPIPVTYIPNNLGLAIKAERILEFEPVLRRVVEAARVTSAPTAQVASAIPKPPDLEASDLCPCGSGNAVEACHGPG